MRIIDMRAINGPNVYLHRPVMIMKVDLEECTNRDSFEFIGLAERLLSYCPGLYEHHCGLGYRGGFVERLFGGTYIGHIIEHVTLELLTRVGYQTNFGKTRSTGKSGYYHIVVELSSEPVTRFLLQTAFDLTYACIRGEWYPLVERLEEARKIARHTDLGPSTRALMNAALNRGIPVKRIGQGSLLQLGTGKYKRMIQATMTQQTSAVAVDIASDKALTKEILRMAGIRVPYGGVATSEDQLMHLFTDIGAPVVIKPLDSSQGRGVSINISTRENAWVAFQLAHTISRQVIVEEYIAGRPYRLLVVDGRLVAASERIPAHVIGNGTQTIFELVAIVNSHSDRGEGHEKNLTQIALDEVALRFLDSRGRSMHDIPRAGEIVYLRDSANLSTGGIAVDVTDHIHPNFAQMAVRAARAVGLDVCGVDVIARDLHQWDSTASVIEVNAAPGIRMHLHPSIGEPRDVATRIIHSLFPTDIPFRVPIVSITGTNGKTTTTRMIRHILQESGYCVGMTSTDGVYIGDHLVMHGDNSGPRSAQLVLSDSDVEMAVLETARGGIIRGGLGYSYADVGIITNVAMDHLGQDGLSNLDDIVHIKSLVAECIQPQTGVAVLNADDPHLVKLAPRLQSPIVWFSMQDDNAVVLNHLSQGGSAVFFHDGWIVEASGALEWKVVRADELPITLHGAARFHVANAMCAVAAVRHLGISHAQCAQSLRQFRSDRHNEGRVNLFRLPSGTHVIADYGHNPDGIRAIGEMVQQLSDDVVPAIIGFPGDRDDEVIREAARTAARYFNPLYVKEDGDTRGRRRGEVAELIRQTVAEVSPHTQVQIEYDECRALEIALDRHTDRSLLILFHEALHPIKELLYKRGAQEVSDLPPLVKSSATFAM